VSPGRHHVAGDRQRSLRDQHAVVGLRGDRDVRDARGCALRDDLAGHSRERVAGLHGDGRAPHLDPRADGEDTRGLRVRERQPGGGAPFGRRDVRQRLVFGDVWCRTRSCRRVRRGPPRSRSVCRSRTRPARSRWPRRSRQAWSHTLPGERVDQRAERVGPGHLDGRAADGQPRADRQHVRVVGVGDPDVTRGGVHQRRDRLDRVPAGRRVGPGGRRQDLSRVQADRVVGSQQVGRRQARGRGDPVERVAAAGDVQHRHGQRTRAQLRRVGGRVRPQELCHVQGVRVGDGRERVRRADGMFVLLHAWAADRYT
jgi:hypothetical protein